jgi:hypothetical protein
MSLDEDRTCKRCSVTRVNALVKAYEQAHQEGGQPWLSRLRQVDQLCQGRGFREAGRLLRPGLEGQGLRSLCWNVSSFLSDEEARSILGVRLP